MLNKSLSAENIDVLIMPGGGEDELSTYERMVVGGRCDSFVVVATRRDDPRIQWLLDRNIPFIAHGRTQIEEPYAWFDVDNLGGIKMATEKLLSLGHRRLCLINAPDALNFAFDRKRGFLEAISEHSESLPNAKVLEGKLDDISGYSLALEALSADERPTAIVCSSVMSAMGVLRAAESLSISVPEELSVIAWDDGVADIEVPGLSVVEAPIGRSGERIGALMLKLLPNSGGVKPTELQEPELVLHQSVGPAPETASV